MTTERRLMEEILKQEREFREAMQKSGRLPPLHLSNTPVLGPTGKRDNVQRLSLLIGAFIPAGRVVVMSVRHDSSCPCQDGTKAQEHCTCDNVDITINEVLPEDRASEN